MHSYHLLSLVEGRRIDTQTEYHEDTPVEVVQVLEECRRLGRKVRLFYGDANTGVSWGEEHDVSGTISRSSGAVKVPLLVWRRSISGHRILDNCIVAILQQGHGTGNLWAYRHPTFTLGTWRVREWRHGKHGHTLPWEVLHNDQVYARCPNEPRAKRLVAFMTGNRIEP